MGETQLVCGMNCGISKDEISNIENAFNRARDTTKNQNKIENSLQMTA